MTDEFRETVREENRTALSRLGSSKALYADTAGELEAPAVLQAAADRAHYAAATARTFADETETAAAREVFEQVADGESGHGEVLTADIEHEPGDRPRVYETLAAREDAVERLGGVVGWALAAGENAGQVVGFFVGQADPATADTVRDVGDARDEFATAAADALDVVCADDDWDRALESASAVVQADYDDYFETLEALGANPKPVC
jgi:hypothetical protein